MLHTDAIELAEQIDKASSSMERFEIQLETDEVSAKKVRTYDILGGEGWKDVVAGRKRGRQGERGGG